MRKRVSLTTYRTTAADTVSQTSYYDYDLDGNVKNLYQQIAGLGISFGSPFYLSQRYYLARGELEMSTLIK